MLRVRLLGPLEADVDGRSVEQPASSRAWELLAWLALHPGEHPRGPLAALLWPDLPAANARAALRQAAWALRRMLGPDERLVLDRRDTLALRCGTDVQEFARLAAAGDGAAALALCRGPLLEGVEGHDWVLAAQEEHARAVKRIRAMVDELPV